MTTWIPLKQIDTLCQRTSSDNCLGPTKKASFGKQRQLLGCEWVWGDGAWGRNCVVKLIAFVWLYMGSIRENS